MTFPAADLRLIAVDMDGTLLDGEGRIPDTLWPLLERLRERGNHFAPASGRQLATLPEAFSAHRDELVFIAENGAHVVSAGVEVSSDALDPVFAGIDDPTTRLKLEVVQQRVRDIRTIAASEIGVPLGVSAGFNSADGD